jgi:uncharacterized membrane protein
MTNDFVFTWSPLLFLVKLFCVVGLFICGISSMMFAQSQEAYQGKKSGQEGSARAVACHHVPRA